MKYLGLFLIGALIVVVIITLVAIVVGTMPLWVIPILIYSCVNRRYEYLEKKNGLNKKSGGNKLFQMIGDYAEAKLK